MAVNPMSRMNIPTPTAQKKEVPASTAAKTEEEKVEETIAQAKETADAAQLANALNQTIPESELISDLDLENFYITGEITYEYKLNDKLAVKFKMIDSQDLLELNDFIYSCYKQDKSARSVLLEHSMRTLAKSMQRYGTTDLSKLTEEQRLDFIRKLPSMVLPHLARKYAVFEASVEKRLSGDSVKN